MSDIVFLNNQYLPKNKATISINDRGFHFADGVYEVIKYYKGSAFRFTEHLQRLSYSLKEVKIDFRELDNLETICDNLIRKNNFEKGYAGIYIQITRGSHQRMHSFPEKLFPTVCIESFELPARKENLQSGIKVITRQDIRWLRCDIKSVSLLANVLMIQEAVELGAKECVFLRNGKVTEATHSSVLGVKNGVIFTHPDSNFILPGITRGAVKDICKLQGMDFVEKPFTKKEIYTLDELFLAGTGNEIMPVVQVDDTAIGNGFPGPITRTIQKHFFEMTYVKLADDRWWEW